MDKRPDEIIPTRASLLERLKDWGDDKSWQDFFQIYKPLVLGTAHKAGLTPSEAEEVLQETLISVAKTIKDFKYDPGHCTFKTWLGHLTRKRIADQFRKRNRHPAQSQPQPDNSRTPHTPEVERVPDPNAVRVEDLWEEEWRDNLLRAALKRLRDEVAPEQLQIFDLYALRKMPAAEVATALGTNVAQVYLAKHRVGRLLKKEVKLIEAQMNRGFGNG